MQRYFVTPHMMGKRENPGDVEVVFLNEATRAINEKHELCLRQAQQIDEQCKQNEILRGLINEGLARETALRGQLEQLNSGWISACKERNALREILTLLAPDLKDMAILYAAQGQHERSQALYAIHRVCEQFKLADETMKGMDL